MSTIDGTSRLTGARCDHERRGQSMVVIALSAAAMLRVVFRYT